MHHPRTCLLDNPFNPRRSHDKENTLAKLFNPRQEVLRQFIRDKGDLSIHPIYDEEGNTPQQYTIHSIRDKGNEPDTHTVWFCAEFKL